MNILAKQTKQLSRFRKLITFLVTTGSLISLLRLAENEMMHHNLTRYKVPGWELQSIHQKGRQSNSYACSNALFSSHYFFESLIAPKHMWHTALSYCHRDRHTAASGIV